MRTFIVQLRKMDRTEEPVTVKAEAYCFDESGALFFYNDKDMVVTNTRALFAPGVWAYFTEEVPCDD